MEVRYREYIINEIEKRFEVWIEKEKGESINSRIAQNIIAKIHCFEFNELLTICKNENIKIPSTNINIWSGLWG